MWKMVPWEDGPASKSAEYLVDIGTDIAQHVAQFRTYNSNQSKQELAWSQLTTKVAASLEELNAWWREWGRNMGNMPQRLLHLRQQANYPFPRV
jgi:hypothetical protein